MNWPLPQEINEAVQNPAGAFADPDLRGGQAVVGVNGLPLPRSGNFADVYQIRGADGRDWAVKCFTRPNTGLDARYAQVSAALAAARLPFTIGFTFLKDGIRIRGAWYPAVKMEWVEGLQVNHFVRENAGKPGAIEGLFQIWVKFCRRLRESGLAHADLQHANVLLVPGPKAGTVSLRMIDYDGMYVPSLAGSPSGETGHPAYQHPQRVPTRAYSPDLDRFPHLVIGTALMGLWSVGAGLWDRYDTGDNLLFTEADFKAPARSELMRELWQTGEPGLQALVGNLAVSCTRPLPQTPWLDQVCPDGELLPLSPGLVAPAMDALGLGRKVPAGAPTRAGASARAGADELSLEDSEADLPPLRAARPGRAGARKRPINLPIVLGAGALVAAGVVATVLAFGGSDKDSPDPSPGAPTAGTKTDAPKDSGSPKTDPEPPKKDPLPVNPTPPEVKVTPPDPPKKERPKVVDDPEPPKKPKDPPKKEDDPPPPPKKPKDPPRVAALPMAPDGRFFPPRDEIVKEAREKIRADFKGEYAQKTPEGKKRQVELFLQLAANAKDQPIRRYVLLDEARALATGGHDAELAARIVVELGKQYAVDAPELYLEAFNAIVMATGSREAMQAVYRLALVGAEASWRRDEFDHMERFAKTAIDAARRGQLGQGLIDDAQSRLDQAKKAGPEVRQAVDKLQVNPDDPEANLIVGKHHLLVLGRWGSGLHFISKGSDPALKELAARDLKLMEQLKGGKPPDTKLADDWWKLASKGPGRDRRIAEDRARYWYFRALGPEAALKPETAARMGFTTDTGDVFQPGLNLINHTPAVKLADPRARPLRLAVNFDGKDFAPKAVATPSLVSLEWDGYILPNRAGRYRLILETTTNQGTSKIPNTQPARVVLGQKEVLKVDAKGGKAETTVTLTNEPTRLVVHFQCHNLDMNTVKLSWSWTTPEGKEVTQLIPPECLFHHVGRTLPGS